MFEVLESGTNKYAQFSLGIKSTGEHNDRSEKYNLVNFSFWKYEVWFKIPPIIKPKLEYVDTTNIFNRPAGYYKTINKNYGFSIDREALHVHYGIQPGVWCPADPKNSDHTKVFFNGWEATDRIRYEFLDLNGNHFAFANDDANGRIDFDAIRKCEATVPKMEIKFNDYDGEEITASCYVTEMEWEYGRGLFKWVKYFRKNIKFKQLQIEFDKEVGDRKGSWKGGTLGTSHVIENGETPQQCFIRFGELNKFTNIRFV